MDNQRLLVWAAFGLMAWFTYQTWMRDHAPVPVPPSTPVVGEAAGPAPTEDLSLPALEEPPAPAVEPDLGAPQLEVARTVGDVIHVTTDILQLEINLQGGTMQLAVLGDYPIAKDRPDVLVDLLNPEPNRLGLIQTGLRVVGGGPEANHLAQFTAPSSAFALDGADELIVPLIWTDEQGVTVEKQIRLSRGSYRIDIRQTVVNDSDNDWRGAAYAQIQRRSFPRERSMFNVDSYSFDGPVIYDGEKSEKLKRDELLDDGPYTVAAVNGWIATIQHHFLSAIVPQADRDYRYSIAVNGNVAVSSAIGPTQTVRAGTEQLFETTVFIGPKLQSQLEEVTPTLKLTVDYGWLTILSQPLFWLLSKVYGVVGNWGWAIILVTVLIKMLFYKLTEKSGRSMAKMREIQPRMKAMQDRYKDDRQALGQAMMELYKREKVNPAAGCLPILIQMPFFLAFYWVLLESVEMRQAPFALWIMDLSSRDPFFILPLIMGAAMFFQQKLNPAPADPVQAKVMQVMPVVFTGFFAFFPAGLVLYWVTNTVLSIAQQWYINKIVHEEAQARKGSKKDKKTP